MERKIIITKRIYKFETKKKYQYIKQYKIKEKTATEKLKDAIGAIFRSKPKEEKKTTEQKPSRFNTKVAIGAILIALLLLFAGWAYIQGQLVKVDELPRAPEKPSFDLEIKDKGIITAGDRRTDNSVAYLRTKMSLHGIEKYDLKMTTYEDVLPSEVYILLSERHQAENYDEFLSSLKKELSIYKIAVNEIDFEKLETLHGGSLVIVPSGLIPEELLGINSKVDLNKLVSRGVVIVYIGQKFDKMITKTGSTPPVPAGFTGGLSINFNEPSITSTDGFNLYQALYRATGNGENSLMYGSVSAIKKGNGALLLLPQTIDGGWVDEQIQPAPEKAGKDIARIILETRWSPPKGGPKIYSANVTNQTTIDFFTNTFTKDVHTIKLEFTAYAKNNINISQILNIQIKKKTKGAVYIEGGAVVTPREVTGEFTRLTAVLQEDSTEKKQLFIKITKNGEEATELQSLGLLNLQIDHPTSSSIDLDSGEYIISIVDDEGMVYAEGYLNVAFIDIRHRPDLGLYSFGIEREGKPKAMKRVNVTVDNKYGPYSFENVDILSVDPTKDAGGLLPAGDHTFIFRIGKIKIDRTVTIPKQTNIFTDPLFLGTIAAAVIITAGGVFLAKQEKVTYQLDIPDFPPIAKVNVPLTKDVILSIFDRINEDYKWKYSTLTIAEIRNGFKKMFYQGKPIYVTDYNVEYILNQLSGKGDVKEFLGYYGPAKWEKETNKSIRLLALFRKIRDICVSNAVPFTQYGESEKCDSEITAVGQDMFLHIYDKDRNLSDLVNRVLGTIKDGMSIVIFKNDFAEREFQSYLASSSKALLTLKLEVEGGSVALFTLEEFESKIKELKGV
ncbi:hypothetical protein J4450_03195 [Candidatus Micrarchaeota archaeon]|nr:hypothetical protein [Candidatus Micrarchaeota archaeon]